MARGVNKVIIVGRLGQDPESRYTASGVAITNISVATSESWKDKQTGEKKEKTEWHRIVAFNRLAEIMGEFLTKGSQVYVEGKITTRKWQGQDGQDRYTTEIVASEMQMLGSTSSGSQSSGSGFRKPAEPSDGGFRKPEDKKPAEPAPVDDNFADDDIPF